MLIFEDEMTEDDDDEPLKPASEPVTGGQAEGAFGWTGLVPVVGHGLVFNWVRLEAPEMVQKS